MAIRPLARLLPVVVAVGGAYCLLAAAAEHRRLTADLDAISHRAGSLDRAVEDAQCDHADRGVLFARPASAPALVAAGAAGGPAAEKS